MVSYGENRRPEIIFQGRKSALTWNNEKQHVPQGLLLWGLLCIRPCPQAHRPGLLARPGSFSYVLFDAHVPHAGFFQRSDTLLGQQGFVLLQTAHYLSAIR